MLCAKNEGVGPCIEMVFPTNDVFDVITLDGSLAELLGIFKKVGAPFKTRLSKSSAVVPAVLVGGVRLG